MFKKYTLILSVLFVLIAYLSLFPSVAKSLNPGVKAPQFNIQSGDDKTLCSDKLQERVVVILYESKDTVEQNRSFKDELTVLWNSSEALKTRMAVLPVIDCSSASWMTKGVWKSNLVKNSNKEKIIIYGDWDGRMSSDYGMEEGRSNIVVIDLNRIIRYFKSGKMDNNEIIRCRELIKQLAE